MSAEGKVFYINHNDKTTHWTRPPAPKPGTVYGAPTNNGGGPSSPEYNTPFTTADSTHQTAVASDSITDSRRGRAQDDQPDEDYDDDGDPDPTDVYNTAASRDSALRNVNPSSYLEGSNGNGASSAAVVSAEGRQAHSADPGSGERAPSATVHAKSNPSAATAASHVAGTARSVASATTGVAAHANPDWKSDAGDERDGNNGPLSALKTGLFGAPVDQHRAGSSTVSRPGNGHGTPTSDMPDDATGLATVAKLGVTDARASGVVSSASAVGSRSEPELPPLPEGKLRGRCPSHGVTAFSSIESVIDDSRLAFDRRGKMDVCGDPRCLLCEERRALCGLGIVLWVCLL